MIADCLSLGLPLANLNKSLEQRSHDSLTTTYRLLEKKRLQQEQQSRLESKEPQTCDSIFTYKSRFDFQALTSLHQRLEYLQPKTEAVQPASASKQTTKYRIEARGRASQNDTDNHPKQIFDTSRFSLPASRQLAKHIGSKLSSNKSSPRELLRKIREEHSTLVDSSRSISNSAKKYTPLKALVHKPANKFPRNPWKVPQFLSDDYSLKVSDTSPPPKPRTFLALKSKHSPLLVSPVQSRNLSPKVDESSAPSKFVGLAQSILMKLQTRESAAAHLNKQGHRRIPLRFNPAFVSAQNSQQASPKQSTVQSLNTSVVDNSIQINFVFNLPEAAVAEGSDIDRGVNIAIKGGIGLDTLCFCEPELFSSELRKELAREGMTFSNIAKVGYRHLGHGVYHPQSSNKKLQASLLNILNKLH